MIVTPNEYLDARRPHWIDHEMQAHVYYDKALFVVTVTQKAPEILAALSVHVTAQVKAMPKIGFGEMLR